MTCVVEIRIFDSSGDVERRIPFSEADQSCDAKEVSRTQLGGSHTHRRGTAQHRVGYPGQCLLATFPQRCDQKVTNKCVCLISPPCYELWSHVADVFTNQWAK